MGLVAFAVCYLFIFLSYMRVKISWRMVFILSLVYLLLLRSDGFQGDFEVYIQELKTGWFSFYYLREPLFWVGSKWLYVLLENEFLVILIYDFIFCFSLLSAVKKIHNKLALVILLVSFPVFLGLENVYRQVLGFPFLLLAINYSVSRRLSLSFAFMLIAFLFHNMYILFAPILILAIGRYSIGVNIALVAVGMLGLVIFLIYFGIDGIEKSSAQSTGLDLQYLYALTIGLFGFFVFWLRRFKYDKWVFFVFINGIIFLLAMSFLGSSQAERVGMISLASMYYSYFLLERRTRRSDLIVSSAAIITLCIPVFVFSSTRGFIMEHVP